MIVASLEMMGIREESAKPGSEINGRRAMKWRSIEGTLAKQMPGDVNGSAMMTWSDQNARGASAANFAERGEATVDRENLDLRRVWGRGSVMLTQPGLCPSQKVSGRLVRTKGDIRDSYPGSGD